MVSSMTKKTILLAISLLVVVISLTGVAMGATAPTVTALSRYTPSLPSVPGKMVRDGAGNFYVTDYWGKGIVKLNRAGAKIGFIPTSGRPTAVALMPDNRLVVGMLNPQPYVAFYSQLGSGTNVTGEETAVFGTAGAPPFYRPTGIVVVGSYIYVLDSGDSTGAKNISCSTVVDPGTSFVPKIRVYSLTGSFLYAIGDRTATNCTSTTLVPELKMPSAIAYEKVGNKIVVVDTQNHRILFFTPYDGASMTVAESIGSSAGTNPPALNQLVRLGNPVDIAFEYDSTPLLKRFYVVEKGRNEISVVNAEAGATYKYDLKRIYGTERTGGTTGAEMRLPNSVVFERTKTGTALGGILYVNNAVTSAPANILPLTIDGGAIPVETITLTMTAIPETVESSSLTVTGTVSPASEVTCSVNGGAGVSGGSSSPWSANVTLQSGMNYILCSATDAGSPPVTTYVEGKTAYASSPSTITVDIAQPVAGVVTNTSTVTVSGSSSAGGNATVAIENSLNSSYAYTLTDASGAWSANVTLAEGSNPITVEVSKPGEAAGTDTVTVIADYTEPAITLAALGSGSTTTSAVQNFDGIVVDDNVGDITTSSISVNGVEVSAAAKVSLATANNIYFSVPVTLVRGANTVTVSATDLAGNVKSESRIITLNPETAGITVTLPADNSYLNASTASASGTVTAGAPFTSVSVNAANATISLAGVDWNTTSNFDVDSGIKGYQFTTIDGNPNVAEKRSIIRDASYVQMAITSPKADLATKISPVTISGFVPIGNPDPTISIDGGAPISISSPNYNSATGAFTYSLPLTVEKTYSVKVSANASTTAVRNIIYDTTLPDVAIQANSSAAPSIIAGSMGPSDKIVVNASLNSSPVVIPIEALTFTPVAGSVNWQVNLSSYPYDSISFDVSDPAGNLTTASVCILSAYPGDVDSDGTVRLSDALVALRHVAGTEVINKVANPDKFRRADVGPLVNGHAGCDGIIDISDAVLILSKSQGLIVF